MRKLLEAKQWMGLALAALLAPAAQAACTYSISPTTRSHGYGAATNIVTVSAGPGCDWSVTNNVSWLTILSGASGTSTGLVTYAVSANTFPAGRTGVVSVAGLSFTVQQDPAPCNFSLTPSFRQHGYGAANNSVAVSGNSNCSWSVNNTSVWIVLTGTTNGMGNGSFPYATIQNPTPVQRTSAVSVAGQVFTVVQLAAPCFYELSPTNRLHGYAGSTGLVTLTASPGCIWSVNNSNSWITITANPSGANSGTFGYSVAPNPNSSPRTGTFFVWDQVFGVYQQPAPCNFSLAPSSVSPGADPEANTVAVNGPGGCAWEVLNTNSWITVTPTNGVSSGTVTWSVLANAGQIGRTGVVTIAGQNFTVKQDAANCTYKLSPTNRVHGYGATSNSVSLTTLSVCPWSVANTNPWVTIVTPTSGFGGASIGYTLSQNNGAGDRMGFVLVDGQTFALTQHGIGCAVDLSPTMRNHGHGAATNTVAIAIAAGCDWDVLNTNVWITVLSGTNGTGSNQLTYAVAPNPTAFARSGYLAINEGSVLISQNAAPCTFDLTPSGFTHNAAQETGTVSVASLVGCNWTVDNTNAWITVLSDTNGTASTNISYWVAPHLSSTSRTGAMTIAGRLYSVIQEGVTCNYRIAPTNRTHGYGATTNTLTMTVSNPCPWSVVNTNPWITILSGASGVGVGTVTYSISANNLSPDDRVGYVVVGGAVSIITQHGLPCTIAVSPSARNHGYNAATGTVNVTAGPICNWSVVNTNPWVTLLSGTSGPGNGVLTYSVSSNGTATIRSGNVLIGDQLLALSQTPYSCSYKLSPTNRTHGFGANTNSASITADPGCAWNVINTNGWITITSPTSGSGNGNFSYTIDANFGTGTRVGYITLMDETLAISQLAPTNGFQFESAIMAPAGGLTVRLGGGPAGIWELQSSSNLVDWVRVADLTNITGRVEYTVPPPAASSRFFRAILP